MKGLTGNMQPRERVGRLLCLLEELHETHEWNLGTNSAFAIAPKRTDENFDLSGRPQNLPVTY